MANTQDRSEHKSLEETNRRMLEDEILCDVVFIAGENETDVRAHRCMLASRSPVFYAMFCGRLAEEKCVNVPDIEPAVLKQFFVYLYTDVAIITEETGLGLLYAAEKYGEEDLKTQCYEFFRGHIDVGSVCPVLTHAMTIGQDDLVDKCLTFINHHAEEVLQNNQFVDLTKDALNMIITSDQLGTSEAVVHKACVRWAENQCNKQDKETSDTNVRHILGDLIFSIRYPLFSDAEIKEHVESTNLLTEDEKNTILEIKQGNKTDQDTFTCRPRYHKFSPLSNGSFTRYDGVIKTYSYSNITDIVCFTCSHSVLLTGVHLFAPSDAGSLRGEMIIYDKDTTLLQQAIAVPYQSVQHQNISLESSISLTANTEYFIEHKCFGPATYNGMNSKKEITKDGVTVTFKKVEKVKNSVTYEDSSHLYGLEFA